jgi:multidrug efflux pump
LVSGMTIGTVFTLFVVPVFYSLIAVQHRPEEDTDSSLLAVPEQV